MYLLRLELFIIWFIKEIGFVLEFRIVLNKELVIFFLCRFFYRLYVFCFFVFFLMYELRFLLIDIVMGIMYKKVIE